MIAKSERYKFLRVSGSAGSVKFHNGEADVTEAEAEMLRRFADQYGLDVPPAPKARGRKKAG